LRRARGQLSSPKSVQSSGPEMGAPAREWNSLATVLKKSSEDDSWNPRVRAADFFATVAGEFHSPACRACSSLAAALLHDERCPQAHRRVRLMLRSGAGRVAEKGNRLDLGVAQRLGG